MRHCSGRNEAKSAVLFGEQLLCGSHRSGDTSAEFAFCSKQLSGLFIPSQGHLILPLLLYGSVMGGGVGWGGTTLSLLAFFLLMIKEPLNTFSMKVGMVILMCTESAETVEGNRDKSFACLLFYICS